MKLTLKDLKRTSKNPMYNMGFEDCMMALRQEAIKDWKKLNEDREKVYDREDGAYLDGQMEWIELFFDLTREDFK